MSTSNRKARNGEAGDPYLVFRVSREECAIPALRVHEIRTVPGFSETAPEPSKGGTLCGSIALHGRAIPVIDLAEVLGHGRSKRSGKQYVIVLSIEAAEGRRHYVGWMVDAISKVVPILRERVVPIASVNSHPTRGRIGRVRINGRFKHILDPDRVLRPEELSIAISLAAPDTESPGEL